MTDIDAVAEALCRIDNPNRGDQPADAYEWDIEALMEGEDGDHYRRMAQAAIDALEIAEERAHLDGWDHPAWQRWASPWVRQEQP